MQCLNQTRCLAIAVACLGFIFPQSLLAAEPTTYLPKPDVVNPPTAMPAPTVYDVVLGQNGALHGKVVDRQGTPLAGTPVGLFQNGRQVAVSTTDGSGQFSVVGLRGGTYLVKAGYGVAVYRLWAPESAPPVARDVAMVVSDSQVVRGQYGKTCGHQGACNCGGLYDHDRWWRRGAWWWNNPWVWGVGVGAAISIPVALSNRRPSS